MTDAPTEIVMPELGASVTEGTVLAWLKDVGDPVQTDEAVCEISTDKVDAEVFSPGDGRLESILVAAGEVADVGTVLAAVASEGPEVVGAPHPARALRDGDARAADRSAAPVPRGYETVPHQVVRTTRIRRLIARHMVDSVRIAAHVTTEVAADLQQVSDRRAALNVQREANGRPKLSYLPFIARATAAALLEHPDLNATYADDHLIRWGDVNLGIAVDAPQGLIVPVLRGAQRLTLDELDAGIRVLADRARTRSLRPDDMVAGTFTISNLGALGALRSTAVINQPQVAILGLPRMARTPVVLTRSDGVEHVEIRSVLNLALTYDHRAIDGGDAVRFLARVRDLLETCGRGGDDDPAPARPSPRYAGESA